MKLYATLTSERNNRPKKMGSDKHLAINLTENDRQVARVVIGYIGKDPILELTMIDGQLKRYDIRTGKHWCPF